MSSSRTWVIRIAFFIAAALFISSLILFALGWKSGRAFWDVITLVFGAVSVVGVGVSIKIYELQKIAADSEALERARNTSRFTVLGRKIERLSLQAVEQSSDSYDMLRKMMAPAVNAPAEEPESEDAICSSDEIDPDILSDPEEMQEDSLVIPDETGEYYLPGAIPIRLLGDLVKWWESQDETGRWTISNLVAGYRAFNRAAHFTGVPWMLTSCSESGKMRSYQISYAGRQKGSSVKELREGGVWKEIGFDDS